MNASEQDVRLMAFPVLSFSHGWLGVASSLDEINEGSILGLKSFQKDLVFIDSEGNEFRVTDVRKVRALPLRLRFGDLLELLSGNRRWQMEFSFSPDSPYKTDVHQVKSLVLECFDKHPEFWNEMTHFDEFRERILASESIDEVFRTFKDFKLLL